MMDGSSEMPRLLADALRSRGVRVSVSQQTEAPYIELPSRWEDYLAALPSQHRYYVNRSLRDFERWAGSAASVVRATDAASLAEGFDVLRSLHGERWSERRAGGAFASSRFDEFHRAATRSLLERGALDLSWLRVRGEPIAAVYSMICGGTVHFYQAGRKVDLPAAVRPGIVLHAHAIRRAIDAGLRQYDFLGGARRYKTQLATARRPLVELRAVRSPALDRIRGAAERAVDEARAVWRRVRDRRTSVPPAEA